MEVKQLDQYTFYAKPISDSVTKNACFGLVFAATDMPYYFPRLKPQLSFYISASGVTRHQLF